VFHAQRCLSEAGPATSEGANRRQTERFAPAGDQAWLGWWEGQTYRKSPATLIDISEGGVKLIAANAPPRRSTSWICLEGVHRTEWVEAEVLEVLRRPDGSAQVRMVFRELCPYSFFEVAVYGIPTNATPEPVTSGWARSTR
jgi:hypothetical protein